MSRNDWMKRYLSGLVGRTIVEVGVNEPEDDFDGFPFFVLDDGRKIEISRDEEGNGPGFLFGLENPK